MKKYNLFGIMIRELKTVKKNRGNLFYVLLFILTVCAGVIPFISIILSRIVIDSLASSVIKDEIFKTVITICGVGLVFEIVNNIIKNKFEIWFLDTRLVEFYSVNNMYLNIDYENIEDAKFRDEFEVATRALSGDGMGFQGVLKLIVTILPLILSAVIYCVVIGMFNLIILFSCLISSAFVVLVNRRIANYLASKRNALAKAERQQNYFTNIAFSFEYGKDIRVYSLQDKLSKDYQKKASETISIVKCFANKRFKLGFIEILFLLIEDAVAYYFIIKSYYNGVISLGEVSMYTP